MLTIGLFGTCGKSTWRDSFIKEYDKLGISYYNPQVQIGEWDGIKASEEAQHLAEDKIILSPITGESYGLGSLAETGFSILNALRLDDRRSFIVMIEMTLDPGLNNQDTARESLRARALALEHLRKLRFDNLYLVDTLKEMFEVSVKLYSAATITMPLEKYNPHRRTR